MSGRALTGVGGHFSAAHHDHFSGKLHGHTWEVTAWFRRGSDARGLACRLKCILARLDHSELPAGLAWGEDIAEWIGTQFDDNACVAVDVVREAELIYARWEA